MGEKNDKLKYMEGNTMPNYMHTRKCRSKHTFKHALFRIAAVTAIAVNLTACADIDNDMDTENDIENINDMDTENDINNAAASPFHAVPYFRDDTGQDVQMQDGCLYSYWDGRLCRHDMETKQETLLFDAQSAQSGVFCIKEDMVYFVVRSPITWGMDDDTGICLYRIKTDGSGLTLLDGNIGSEEEYYLNIWALDYYEDVLYLLLGTGDGARNFYYRLEPDGSVQKIDESETLYATLPEGYEEPEPYYINLPSLPYQMRHYGYMFLVHNKELCVYAPQENVIEPLISLAEVDDESLFLTNDALCYCADDHQSYGVQWYRLSLDNLKEQEEWMLFQNCWYNTPRIFWDESGFYYVDQKGDGRWDLYQAGWEDATPKRIISSAQTAERGRFYWDGEAIYYAINGSYFSDEEINAAGDCVVREKQESPCELFFSLERHPEGERPEDICIREIEQKECLSYDGMNWIEFSLNKVIFTQDTEGMQNINRYLENVYGQYQEKLDHYREELGGQTLPLDGSPHYEDVDAFVAYLDGQYVSVCISDGRYLGGAHSNYTRDYYVFDRVTGERMSLTDLVEESPEEICDIVEPYVKKSKHTFNEWVPKESILEQDRFYLTEHGIGIHYDTYELGAYLEGELDYVIPYSKFTGERLQSLMAD